jgi:hypothetical protein
MSLFKTINKLLFKPLEKDTVDRIVKQIDKKGSQDSFLFRKDASTGQIRWVTAWSSNYEDDDNPPDIISEKAHREYIERVEKGEVPYPELWHWHTKGTKWGEADWLAYDKDAGIMWASGLVDEGHEKEALNISKSNIKIGVSHGMKNVSRDPNIKKVINSYTTYEISDLPFSAAANKMTGLFITEEKSMEDNMALADEKKDYLRNGAGLSDEDIDKLDAFGKEQAQKFSDRMRKDNEEDIEDEQVEDENKDVEETEDTNETESEKDEQEDPAEKESETAKGDNGEETEPSEAEEEDSKEEDKEGDLSKAVELAFDKSFKPFGEEVVKTLQKFDERLKEIEKAQKQIEKRQVDKELQPMSVDSLLKSLRSIDAEEAEVDEKDELGKPEETESKEGEFAGKDFSSFLSSNLFGE